MCRPSLNDINCSIRKIVDTLIPPTFYAQQSFRTLSTTYSNHIAQLVGSRFCHNTACCVSFTHSRVWFVLGLIINIVDMFLQYQSKSSQQCFSTMFFTISTPILGGCALRTFPYACITYKIIFIIVVVTSYAYPDASRFTDTVKLQ